MKRSTYLRALASLALVSVIAAPVQGQTPPALTLGEQRTLVMLVNFQDDTRQPYSAAYAHDLVFNSVSNFYLENSSGQTWLAGDVVGWFTLPMSASVCDTTLMSQLADQAASGAGVNLGSYSRHVYAFPGSPCGWAGFATYGSLPTRAWISGSISFNLVAHEIGHSFGLGHAGAVHCDGSPLGDPCTSGELADPLDVMGSLGQGHFNAFHKERLGWLNYGVAPSITTIQGSGTYAIDPLESVQPGTKALKILKGVDQATGYRTWYYVEARRALGFDTYLPGGTSALSGVLVRMVNEPGATSYLVDMTSGTSQYQDSALPVGQTFSDDQAGVSITPLSVSDAGASISVTLSPGACTPGTPSLKLSSQAGAVTAGSAVSYTLTLTNTDSSTCGSSSFNLGAALPAGWSGTFASPSLVVSAGGSASTTLQVTSASTATAGTYNFNAQASNSSHSATVSASYVVAAPLTIAVAPGSTTYPLGSDAVIAASVYRGGIPVAGAAVTFKITPPGGKTTSAKVVTDANGAATYVLTLRRKATVGTYSVLATVSAGGTTASASTSFKVY